MREASSSSASIAPPETNRMKFSSTASRVSETGIIRHVLDLEYNPASQQVTPQDLKGSRLQSISCVRLAVASAVLLATVGLAWAGEARVPYVPTPQSVVDTMLEIAKVGPRDYLIDLGSGDGRIVITAAKQHGARGFGVDINPERIKEGEEN